MNNYSVENQPDIIFTSSNSTSSFKTENDDSCHTIFCELYVYDHFQNKRLLFKGLGKVSMLAKNSNDVNNPSSSNHLSTSDHIEDRSPVGVRQINSIYGEQLRKRFSCVENPEMFSELNSSDIITETIIDTENDGPLLFNLETIENSSSETLNEIDIHRSMISSDSECSNDWNEHINLTSVDITPEFHNDDSRNIINDYIEVENFTETTNISSEFIDNHSKDISLESLHNIIPESIDASNRLDYELLLPQSVVESSTYLPLQENQSPHDGISDYTNIYKGLFDQNDDMHSFVTEDIEKKGDFENYFSNHTDDYSSKDEDSYFITDISNLTQSVKKENLLHNKQTEVNCDICYKKCRSINALNHHMLVHSEDRPFVCEICKKAFKEQPTLRRHMWTHMEKQHQCDICKKLFVEKSSLRRHISTIHADFKPGSRVVQNNIKQQYSCFKCGKVFKSHAKFNMHQEMHGNPNYECEICGKVYAGRSHLKIHQRIHTGEKPYVCTICNMKFAFKHVLKSHQARIHQKVHKFKCNLCSLTFIKKSDLSSHASCHMLNLKKNKRHYVSRKNSKKFIPVIKKSHITKSNKKNIDDTSSGPIQGLFGQLIDLIPERNKSEDDNAEDVDKSDSIDSKDGICKSPKSLIDQGKKNKECMNCFKAFERMGDLKRHIISHIVEDITNKAKEQNTVPVYKCEICCAVFKQVDKFKKHLREHAHLTLYQCDICDRAFGDSSNFSKHKKVHGVSFLKCTICSRKFNTKRMMVMHMEYHRHNQPKTCNYCKKLFHFDSNLRKHIKIAHLAKGKMTYRCEECGERFNSVKLKWEHQWDIHQMRKVDADCHICNAQFRKVSLLRAHLIKEHATLKSLN